MYGAYIVYGVVAVVGLIVSHNMIYYDTYTTRILSEYELSSNRTTATCICLCWPVVIGIAATLGLFAAIGWGLCEVVSLPARLIVKKRGLSR